MTSAYEQNRQNSSLIFLEVIIIIAGLYFGVWWQMNKNRVLSQNLSSKQQEFAIVKDKEAKLETLKREFSTRKSELQNFNIAAPEMSEIPEALMMIEAIVSRSGADLTNLTPQKPTGGQVEIDLCLASNYEQMKTFFTILKNNLRPVSVDSIKVLASQDASAAQAKSLSVSVKLKMPYMVKNNDKTSDGSSNNPSDNLSNNPGAGPSDGQTINNTQNE
ncbi:MAG: hypothetical protein CEN89_210 [Candidatus Berkelbacteria bacterium Licking1014_7]|uniref:Type IV pilus assembly protein PilO n=1 Tax=Candidatus Berkelbacteria bacterium Licking1014_7 TaxID=2017147 RepID=A0A554LK04_9BACT|nr:MAG: hypothetical protein CEN89_210 [Candidatus Berkelbacteria bacterium Licking1014_7]